MAKSIEELRAELTKRAEERALEIQAKAEEIRINNELRILESDRYEQRTLFKEDNDKLNGIMTLLEEAYENNDRKMSFVFGYGVIESKILAIVKAIQYLKQEQKEEFLAMVNLDELTIEELIEVFGSPAYYSKQQMEIVPAIDMDIERTKSIVCETAKRMGLVSNIECTKFNKANVDAIYERALIKAEETKELNNKFLKEAVDYAE